jgi:hypothetical protein
VLVRGYWVQLRQKDIGFGLASGFHCVLQDKICLFVCATLNLELLSELHWEGSSSG